MADDAARQAVAADLKAMRLAAGLSGVAMGRALDVGGDVISKIERGTRRAKPDEIRAWVKATGREPATAELLIAQSIEAEASTVEEWADALAEGGQGRVQQTFRDLIAGSTRIAYLQLLIVPGPLQTPEYARAVLEASERRWRADGKPDPASIDAAVEARLSAWRYLSYPSHEFTFVVSEAAFGNPVVSADAMATQIEHVRLAVDMTGVWCGVIPQWQPDPVDDWVAASFEIYDSLVMLDTEVEGLGRRGGLKVERYWERLNAAKRLAVTGEAAHAVLDRAVSRLR